MEEAAETSSGWSHRHSPESVFLANILVPAKKCNSNRITMGVLRNMMQKLVFANPPPEEGGKTSTEGGH